MRATVINTSLWVAALAVPLVLAQSTPASAATLQVSNCNDSGPGSLRSRVAMAASGDTIDLAHLACSRISLTSGQIVVPQQDLKLVGRSRDALTIDGNLHDRVLWHRGVGRLRLEHLSLAHGFRTQADDPRQTLTVGGCLRADGNLDLYRTRIHHCTVMPGHGGAVAVPFGNASISNSLVTDNVARGDEEFQGSGAGIYVRHHLVLYRSRVSQNRAFGGGGGVVAGSLEMSYALIDHNTSDGVGGVLTLDGPANVLKSTIADNDSDGGGVGGIGIFNVDNAGESLVADSTISRNRGAVIGGAEIYGNATVANSTIAFNREGEGGLQCAGGLVFRNMLHVESTIVASNLCAGTHVLDLAGYGGAALVGSHNLVGKSNLPVPGDTLSAAPRLGPLVNNGGPTPTHALLCDSPAIDRGNNLLRFAYDQRGPGYPRVKGLRTDIGAFEK